MHRSRVDAFRHRAARMLLEMPGLAMPTRS